MDLTFYKYQGTGNDFVLMDNRENFFPKDDIKHIAQMCHRRFGIGADGLILLEDDITSDFKMIYYNSDGNRSTMCGNGGRCIVHFAEFLGIIRDNTTFRAIDGLHKATIHGDFVSLKMNDVDELSVSDKYIFLDTGSPHHVQIVEDLENFDLKSRGKDIRYGIYGQEGANVNFVEKKKNDIFAVRTYERGVEDETLSCGTGVTAVALAMFETGRTVESKVTLETPGGNLQVRFEKIGNSYKNIYLEGPATQVFKGVWKWKL